MPNSFVLRLRDMYYKQKMEEKRQTDLHMAQMSRNTQNKYGTNNQHNNMNSMPPLNMDDSLLGDMLDELS